MPRAKALASDPVAQQAAEDFLMLNGSAVGAVLCGFFAAAGAHAGVLWGPSTILVGGVGVGARCFDGRLLQPGEGTKRPRGFLEEEEIPSAARVPATAAVAAALVAHAYAGGQKLASLLKPGVSRARQSGADSRAELLTKIRSAGAGALSEPSFVRELMRIAGPAQGGLLTPQDFDVSRLTIDQPVSERQDDQGQHLSAPWEAEVSEVSPAIGHGHAVIAVDVRGVAAALSFRRVIEGVSLSAMDLELPLAAVPVQRGVTRVSPGARLPAPCPIEIILNDGAATEVLAYPMAPNLSAAEGLWLRLRRDPQTREVVALAQ